MHRSYIADLHRVCELRSRPGSRYDLLLEDDREIPVGRTRLSDLRSRLSVD